MPRAIWNGQVLAESDDTVVVEGNHYFPREALNKEFFAPSDHTTYCGWKGEARYYDLVVSGEVNSDAAWSYPEPSDAAREIAGVFRTMPEVTDYQIYVGTSAPFNFNGLVRHYFLRSSSNVADVQVNFVHKHLRDDKSHALANEVRQMLQPIADQHGVVVKVTEIPPGPPVLSTLVAEVYGPDQASRIALAEQVKTIHAIPGRPDAFLVSLHLAGWNPPATQ